ncbi:MAG: PspC domain-containing protein [Acidobacteria bacterium]|nr:PspC domain-containing protein [Acidobacteriota bacterium]
MPWRGAPFRRSRRRRLLGGVCGGLAEAWGLPPLLVRVLYVVVSLALIFVPGWLVYLILWAVIPLESETLGRA